MDFEYNKIHIRGVVVNPNAKESLRPLGDRIVVRRETPADKTPGGILLPDNGKEKPTRGVVVAVGPGKDQVLSASSVLTNPLSVNVGDVVLFTSYAGNSVELDGEELLIMREDDILCVVEKSK